jgi:hypothetical protein
MNCGPSVPPKAAAPEHQILCHGCATPLPESSFGRGQLKKKHPRCRACAPNKFSNRKSSGSDSHRESRAARDLETQQRAGIISKLELQVPFELIPAQRAEDGKLIERACRYVADFTYYDADGRFHVVDAKGTRTEVYRLKRKLMLQVHKIQIEEI